MTIQEARTLKVGDCIMSSVASIEYHLIRLNEYQVNMLKAKIKEKAQAPKDVPPPAAPRPCRSRSAPGRVQATDALHRHRRR